MLKTCYHISLSLFLMLFTSTHAYSDGLASKTSTTLFEATYKGKISGFNITMVRTLTQQPSGQFIFTSAASNFFASFEEVSAFIMEQNSIEINSYTYKRSIARRKTIERIDYNWKNMIAEYKRSNREDSHQAHGLTQNMLDPSLYQLFLQADTFLNKPSLEYSFIKRKRIEHYSFKRLPNETIKLDNKEYNALVLMREDSNKRKKTKVWILPELDHQIGKIEHTDKKGSTYRAYLSQYNSNPKALHAFYKSARTAKNSRSQNK